MKKIKRGARRSMVGPGVWDVGVFPFPDSLDPAQTAALFVVSDRRKSAPVEQDVIARPISATDVAGRIAARYEGTAENRRPLRIEVMGEDNARAVRETLEPTLRAGAPLKVVAVHSHPAARAIEHYFSQSDEPVSSDLALGLASGHDEFVALMKRYLAISPAYHYFDGELLRFERAGTGDQEPESTVASILGAFGIFEGLALHESFEAYDALEDDDVDPALLDFEAFILSFDHPRNHGYVYGESMKRRGWLLEDGRVPLAAVVQGDAPTDVRRDDECARMLERLRLAIETLEALGRDGFPPYPECAGEVTLDDGSTVRVETHAPDVEAWHEEMALLREHDLVPSPDDEVVRLRVELGEISPPIWREVEVSSRLTLAGLHQVIQLAMGWEDDHMWQFEHGDRVFTLPGAVGDDQEEAEIPADADARLVTLAQALGSDGASLEYLYDFGDNWVHLVTVVERHAPEPGVRYPRVLGGERAAPPEDCGGVGGYLDLLEELASPDPDPELIEWLASSGFDPERVAPLRGVLASTELLNRMWIETTFGDARSAEGLSPGVAAFSERLNQKLLDPDIRSRVLNTEPAELPALARELLGDSLDALPPGFDSFLGPLMLRMAAIHENLTE